MSLQTNKPSDFNSLSELYMKASEARFQLLQERSEFRHGDCRTTDATARTAGAGIAEQGRSKAERIINETYPIKNYCIMNRDQILRRNDEITAETDAVIRRGKEIVSKLESGAIKPDDPQVKEVLQQLIERRRIGNEFNAELTRLVHEQSDEPTRTPR